MFKQLTPNLAKNQNNIINLPHRNFTMLKLQAVFHFCLQINNVNVNECCIHYVIHKHLHYFFLIFLAYLKFIEFEPPSMLCRCKPRHTSLFSYEGSSTSRSSEGGFAKVAPSSRFFFSVFFFFSFFLFFSLGPWVV